MQRCPELGSQYQLAATGRATQLARRGRCLGNVFAELLEGKYAGVLDRFDVLGGKPRPFAGWADKTNVTFGIAYRQFGLVARAAKCHGAA